MSPRIAVIGPHRRRTGTGPFVLDFLRSTGCEVEAWGREESARRLGNGAARPALDAVAICSPPETHLDYLEAAVAQGLHVFCEKPIAWPADHSCSAFDGLITRLEAAVESAAARRLIVHENTQWVYTLEGFQRLAGQAPSPGIRQFRCELSPSRGDAAGMLMECSAHANALLLALKCGGVECLRADYSPRSGSSVLGLSFLSRNAAGGPVEVEYRFGQQSLQPRHAAFEIDRLRVERRVDPDGYRIFLRHKERDLPIEDPVRRSVETFVGQVRSGAVCRTYSEILANLTMSCTFLQALPGTPEAIHA